MYLRASSSPSFCSDIDQNQAGLLVPAFCFRMDGHAAPVRAGTLSPRLKLIGK
jgi:hypothetical protein